MIGMDVLLGNASPGERDRVYGITIGVVTNNKDPEGLGRVKVKFPWRSEQDESYWARVMAAMAGNQYGLYFLPEVGCEVVVAFEHGDIRFPYILGALWNGKDKPPVTNQDGKNNQRMLKSRSGHVILLDDTQDEEMITIRDKSQKNEIIIDSSKKSMMIKVGEELTIETGGKISLKSSKGDLEIDCQNLSINAKQNCNIKANSGIGIECMAGVKINNGALEVT
ncbi:phage baseplate assembly protein V [Leptothermofonsia sp. ETS-13]|uniref:phage baseplate assembly protein V n=1 Tax=Leptothermofonsia sp. ETS-13 TaxID=3035696 RepID=UPI003B9F7E5C